MAKRTGDLESLSAPKGGEGPRPGPAAPAAEPRVRTLSLRLTETDYQALRRLAFDADRSHQDVIEAALREYLGKAGR